MKNLINFFENASIWQLALGVIVIAIVIRIVKEILFDK